MCGLANAHGLDVEVVEKVVLEDVLQQLRLPPDCRRQVLTNRVVELDLNSAGVFVDNPLDVIPGVAEPLLLDGRV